MLAGAWAFLAVVLLLPKYVACGQPKLVATSLRNGLNDGKKNIHNLSAATSANISAAQARETQASARVSKVQGDATVEQQCEISQQYTASPSLCPMGNNRIPVTKLQQYLLDFKQVWAAFRAQFPGRPCCMGLNHQFALYATIRELQPAVIIESGIAKGHNTWLLRHIVGPIVPIFSIDPGDPLVSYPGAFGGWKDLSGQTRYFTAQNFQDLSFARWDLHIPDPVIRSRTLLVLDDHQSSIERLKLLRHWGFRWAFYEDNYPFAVATSLDSNTCKHLGNLPRTWTKPLYGDGYSTNTICAPVPLGTTLVLEKDRFGLKCKFLSLAEHLQNTQWMQTHVETYFEFPAAFSTCKGLARPPLLGSDPQILAAYGFPEPSSELWHYGHLFPSFVELKPLGITPRPVLVNGVWTQMTEQQEELAAGFKHIAAMTAELKSGKWYSGL